MKYGITDYLKKELLFDVKGGPYISKFDETAAAYCNTGHLQRMKLPMLIVICFHWPLYLQRLCASLSWNWRIAGLWFRLPFISRYGWTQHKQDVFKHSCCRTWRETQHTVFGPWNMFSLFCLHCFFYRREGVDFDEYFNDIHFFFKLSGARRKNYASFVR